MTEAEMADQGEYRVQLQYNLTKSTLCSSISTIRSIINIEGAGSCGPFAE